MSLKNFVSYEDESQIVGKIATKLNALNGAYVIRGNSTFANLPSTLTEGMNGYVYNVTDEFTTDARFVEGAGKKYAAGTNVVIVDLSTYDEVTPVGNENPTTEGWYELVSGKYVLSEDTEVDNEKTYYAKTVTVKFDVIGTFVDVDGILTDIQAVSDMIAGEFDNEEDYAVGDVVVHEKKLYKFTTAYTAYTPVEPVGTENPSEEGWYESDGAGGYTLSGDTTVDVEKTYYQLNEWDSSKVSQTTVETLIKNAEPDSLTTAQINALLALLD